MIDPERYGPWAVIAGGSEGIGACIAAELSDAGNVWRRLPYALLLASLLIFGFFPSLLSEKIKPSAAEIVKQAGGDFAAELPRATPALEVVTRKTR